MAACICSRGFGFITALISPPCWMTFPNAATSWRAWLPGCSWFHWPPPQPTGQFGNSGESAGRPCTGSRTSQPSVGLFIIGGSSSAGFVHRSPSRWCWPRCCWRASSGPRGRGLTSMRKLQPCAKPSFFYPSEHICFQGRVAEARRCGQQVFFLAASLVKDHLDLAQEFGLGRMLHESLELL